MISKLFTSNRSLAALVFSGLFIFLISAHTVSCTKRHQMGNLVVMEVNGEKLRASEFAEQLGQKLKAFDALSVQDEAVIDRSKKEVLRGFLIEKLTESWAKEQGLFVSKEMLDKEINSLRSFYPDDLAFRRALSAEGLSFERWKQRLRYSLLEKLVISKLTEKAGGPTESEVKDYYNNHKNEFKREAQVHLRQIVVDSESHAKRLLDELKRGKALKDLAKKFSISPEAEASGDMGWIDQGTLDIFDEAFNMRIGQKSRILKSPYGYHIYELLGKRKAGYRAFEEVKGAIKRQLMEKKEQALYSAWLEELLRRARVFKDEKLIAKISVEIKSE